MATAKQRAWRAKFARMYGGGRKKKRTRTSTGGSMARRRRKSSYRGRRRGGSRGGMMSKGILPVGGFIGAALLGLGASAVAKRFIGSPLGGFTGAAAGFAVGGLPGALGGYVHDNIGNVMPGGQVQGGAPGVPVI